MIHALAYAPGSAFGPQAALGAARSVNGRAMDQMYYDHADRTFRELMKDIDGSLPANR